MIELTTIGIFIVYYIVIGIIFILINAIIIGYVSEQLTISDFQEGLIWPFSLAVLLGTLIRLFIEYIKFYR